jgi:hypothetical protein
MNGDLREDTLWMLKAWRNRSSLSGRWGARLERLGEQQAFG